MIKYKHCSTEGCDYYGPENTFPYDKKVNGVIKYKSRCKVCRNAYEHKRVNLKPFIYPLDGFNPILQKALSGQLF